MDEILSKGTHLTDGQYLIIITISATVLLVILQFLKRRLIRNESPDELYEDIAPALGRQINTHELGPIFIVQEDSSGSGNRHCPPVPFFRVIKFVQRSGQIAFRVVAEPNGRVNLHLDFCVSPSSEKENNHGR